ncbi:hypothetical protein [Paraburkholderia sediminicola]|uniref:hypothetical protein n=1 Tax=Paraburkholderia sediminicola TaxID=458836 RepID=UPI0038BDD106
MNDHYAPCRRLRYALVCGTSVAAMLISQQGLAQGSDSQYRAPEGHSSGGPSGGVGFGLSLPGLMQLLRSAEPASTASTAAPTPSAETPTVKQLLSTGPQFPDSRTADRFDVTGLLKGGWPLVIDFLPAPGSCTFVVVFIGEQASPPVTIDSNGRQGRHLVKLEFPAGPPEQPVPARYLVQSQTPACPSGDPSAYAAAHKPSRLEIYGIGAGPRAVGSVAVNDLHFGPPSPNIRTDKVTYEFTTKSLFNRGTIEFLRFESPSANGPIRVTPVQSIPAENLGRGPHGGSWNGLDAAQHASLGIHRLEVRAWDNREDDNSWAGGISDDIVTITQP